MIYEQAEKPIEVFVSYKHTDPKQNPQGGGTQYAERLRTFLRPYERQGLLKCYWDGDIKAGSNDFDRDIQGYLASASIIVYLINADFLASELHQQCRSR